MNKLSSLYDEIRNYEKNLVKPCLITKDTDSSFEVWISKGNSSIFFSSIVLLPDRLTIKFNPNIIKDTLYDLYIRKISSDQRIIYRIIVTIVTGKQIGRAHV